MKSEVMVYKVCIYIDVEPHPKKKSVKSVNPLYFPYKFVTERLP